MMQIFSSYRTMILSPRYSFITTSLGCVTSHGLERARARGGDATRNGSGARAKKRLTEGREKISNAPTAPDENPV
jgi:hypothetical protein